MTDPINVNDSNHASNPIPRFRDAYQRLSAEILAVPDSDFVAINIDVPIAVTTVLGAMPEIKALRPRVAEELPKFDISSFDKMEDYTLALGHAQAMYLAASGPVEPLPELAAEAMATRDLLFSDALALSNRSFIDGKKLAELKGGNGYRNIAFDLFALVAMLREKWTAISGKTALTAPELDSAEQLADRLITAVGKREQATAVVGVASDQRQRAFALFVNAYHQVRRAVSFLRWNEGDVDSITPSVYAGRATGKKKSGDEPAQANPPGTNGTNATTTPATATTPAMPNTSNTPVTPVTHAAPAGFPGSNPYVQ